MVCLHYLMPSDKGVDEFRVACEPYSGHMVSDLTNFIQLCSH